MTIRIRGPEALVAITMLITSLIVLLINIVPVFTQPHDFCILEGSLEDAKRVIDSKIERNELEHEGEQKIDYLEVIAVDHLDERGELSVRDYETASTRLKGIIDAKIGGNQFISKEGSSIRSYYYLVASDILRPNGGIFEREYYDINKNKFAKSRYDETGLMVCYTNYYNCNNTIMSTIYPPIPWCGIYPG